jgi:energy-coupling factor transport system ATP-binding protein
MVTMEKLVEVVELSFTHIGQSQPIFSEVNLSLYSGEIVLISGATGSGKSTLLNCIAGVSPIHVGGRIVGDILYQGVSILGSSVRERSQYIGTVLQNVETQIFTDKAIEEVIFGLENLNVSAEIISNLTQQTLKEFGLLEQQNWSIGQLSAGQKQRLILACVLAMNQPVLLLDEPFAYLDRTGCQLLLQLLTHRAQQGQSILIVEHRSDLIQEICDTALAVKPKAYRTYHLHQGKLQPASPSFPGSAWECIPGGSASTKTTQIVLQTHQISWNNYPPYPDLQIQTGETVLLQGDNGCGKTTLLKLISGLLKPTTGKIEILGKNTAHQKIVDTAKNVGFILQNPNHQLFAESVYQEVIQPQVHKQQAERLLENLNLTSLSHKHPQSLSQGQKRRLALAAVLARQPKICLLDEITVGQDPQSLALMVEVLREFTKQGGALILTSHTPQVADYLNARIVYIE